MIFIKTVRLWTSRTFLSLLSTAVILTLAFSSSLVVHSGCYADTSIDLISSNSLASLYAPMPVSQSENQIIWNPSDSVWQTDTQTEIFKVSYENHSGEITVAGKENEQLIAPGTKNDYTFVLNNNSRSYLDYKVSMVSFVNGLDQGDSELPVEVRVYGPDGWLLGDASTWLPVRTLNTLEYSAVLTANSEAKYVLQWRWPYHIDSAQDKLDTWLGCQNKDITLTIQINTQASVHTSSNATPPITSSVPSIFASARHDAYLFGYEDGTIRPNANITRAEAAAIFYRLLAPEFRNTLDTSYCGFPDVTTQAWYFTEVAAMTNAGIFRGYEDDTFRGDQPMTRAEMATVISKFQDQKLAEHLVSDFSDIRGHWAEQFIITIERFHWIIGYEDGTFRPDQPLTRAEAVCMINRMLHRMPERAEDLLADMFIWPDNADPDAWYFIPIQEATHSHEYLRLRGTREHWLKILPFPASKTAVTGG